MTHAGEDGDAGSLGAGREGGEGPAAPHWVRQPHRRHSSPRIDTRWRPRCLGQASRPPPLLVVVSVLSRFLFSFFLLTVQILPSLSAPESLAAPHQIIVAVCVVEHPAHAPEHQQRRPNVVPWPRRAERPPPVGPFSKPIVAQPPLLLPELPPAAGDGLDPLHAVVDQQPEELVLEAEEQMCQVGSGLCIPRQATWHAGSDGPALGERLEAADEQGRQVEEIRNLGKTRLGAGQQLLCQRVAMSQKQLLMRCDLDQRDLLALAVTLELLQ